MAKMKKYPKQPKAKASLEVWTGYRDKCKEVDKFNAQIDKDKKAKESVMKQVKAIKKK